MSNLNDNQNLILDLKLQANLLMLACITQAFLSIKSYRVRSLGRHHFSYAHGWTEVSMSRNRNSMIEDVVVAQTIAGAAYGNREYGDMIVGYVDEYEDLLEHKRIRYNEE